MPQNTRLVGTYPEAQARREAKKIGPKAEMNWSATKSGWVDVFVRVGAEPAPRAIGSRDLQIGPQVAPNYDIREASPSWCTTDQPSQARAYATRGKAARETSIKPTWQQAARAAHAADMRAEWARNEWIANRAHSERYGFGRTERIAKEDRVPRVDPNPIEVEGEDAFAQY